MSLHESTRQTPPTSSDATAAYPPFKLFNVGPISGAIAIASFFVAAYVAAALEVRGINVRGRGLRILIMLPIAIPGFLLGRLLEYHLFYKPKRARRLAAAARPAP